MNKELRVKVALDVIERLNTKAYLAATGSYIEHPSSGDLAIALDNLSPGKPCTVCALGAMALSHFQLSNISPDEYLDPNSARDLRESMSEVFEDHQLRLIEQAFEWERPWIVALVGPEAALAQRYRPRHGLRDDREALLHIMQNVVDNNGVFVPLGRRGGGPLL